MTVKLDVTALKSAVDALQSLADAIDFHRDWCTRDCPVDLASLAEGTTLTGIRDWLTDQKPDVQTVHDLAYLLDTEGNGPVEIPGTGSLEEIREQLGTELAQQMRDGDPIENPEDMERYADMLTMLDRYEDDIRVTGAFHTELGPEGLSTVLLDDRHYLYEDTQGTAAGDVLAAATVQHALDNNYQGENAATISSWAISYFGGKADPPDGVKEELGAIVSTYIRDVGRVALDPNSADTPGTYGPDDELPPGLFEGEGFPPYGIRLDRTALNNLLGDIGDNDVAISLIGDANGRLAQGRLDQAVHTTVNGGPFVDEADPFNGATLTNSAVTGFLYDGLFDGRIDDAQGDAAEREKMWKFLMVPTEFVEVPGGPIGNYVVGSIKDRLKEEFVGDGVAESISSAEDGYNEVRTFTTMQSLYTLVTNEEAASLPAGSLREDWPTDSSGNPVHPNDLTSQQQTDIIASVNDPSDNQGYALSTYKNGLSGMDLLQEQYP